MLGRGAPGAGSGSPRVRASGKRGSVLISQQIRLAWRTMRRLLQGEGREVDELRARHLRAVFACTPWMMAANLLAAGLCVFELKGRLPGLSDSWLLAWAVTLGLASLAGLLGWWRIQRRPLQAAPARLVRRTAVNAQLFALLWSGLAVFALPGAGPQEQLFLAVLVIGMLAGGGLAMAMLPPAALPYLGLMAVGSVLALWRDGQPMAPTLQLLAVVYAGVLAVASLAVAQLFQLRWQSEREAARQGEVVGLLLRDFEETAADVLWEIDVSGRFVQVSERLAATFALPPAKLGQFSLLNLLQSLQVEGSQGVEKLRAAMAGGEAFRDKVVRVNAGQGTRWWSLTAKPLLDAEGSPRGWRGVLADVSAERKSHQHLSYLAHFDSLTGLVNRVSLRRQLGQLIERSLKNPDRRAALMCMDLDNFKGINDSLGHSVGDAVLKEVATRLRQHVSLGAVCGRLGGDEFAVVLEEVGDEAQVRQLAEDLVRKLRMPVQVGAVSVPMGVSVGLAFLPTHARSVDEALVHADLALYAAKAAGRGRVQVFDEALGERQRRRILVERELGRAVVNNELQLLYQPQVDLETWTITGAEALLRWQHPLLGAVSPVEFIPVAEKSGQIHDIGSWVLASACADAKRWLSPLRIAVNVSAPQVQGAQLAKELRMQLQRYQLEPDRLEIEITESLLVDNVQTALQNLHAIRQLGVRIALDDFGTGYSSLAYLRLFPFDKLKIDRAFVGELMHASDARAIVRTMLELARILGMETIAEGVEEPAQLEVLGRVGCKAIQGFLVARPMTAPQLAALLERWPQMRRPQNSETLPDSVQGSLSEAL
jgi:diguanylate cyclase (GGDEF)-like protein/PAS domain S-box-containing protein